MMDRSLRETGKFASPRGMAANNTTQAKDLR